LYYLLMDAAAQLGVGRDWLRRMVKIGQIPKRYVGNTFVVNDADIELARKLLPPTAGKRLPPAQFKGKSVQEVGYTLDRFAEMTELDSKQIAEWARDGLIDCQQLGHMWIIFPSALLQVDSLRTSIDVSTERKQELTYRTNKGNPKKIPPLDDVWKLIVELRLAGKSFAEIGRDERVGKSRERTNKIYATVLQRVALLQQRGIVQVDKIAETLHIDVDTANKLIEQVK
jgi:hypothetical protein